MAEDRPARIYRAGLGLPPAIIIRSAPGPSHYDQAASYGYPIEGGSDRISSESYPQNVSSANAIPLGQAGSSRLAPSTSTVERELPRETIWREWNTNPASHGPPKLVLPPKFVPSSGRYDELGRSLADGVEVSVEKGKERYEGWEDGQGVAGWYLALAARSAARPEGDQVTKSALATPVASVQDSESSRPAGPTQVAQAGPSRLRAEPSCQADSAAGSAASTAIDLTLDDDDSDNEQAVQGDHDMEVVGSTPVTAKIEPPITSQGAPLRVHSKEWFIRRALLRQAQSDVTPLPVHITRPTSIGSMLHINPIARPSRRYEPTYALGPENKGYALLKDRLGWEGGGLGRARQGDGKGTLVDAADTPEPAMEVQRGSERWPKEEEVPTEAEGHTIAGPAQPTENAVAPPTSHPAVPSVVDLTLSDSECDLDSAAGVAVRHSTADSPFDPSYQPDLIPEPVYGPGRTAPIATTLKLDRLGLGHRAAQPSVRRPHMEKKVTHTAEEIAKAQRAAKFGKGRHHGQGLELGKKGKVRWKERDRKERDERRQLAAALNA
ncbi:hypothetical protein IAU60_004718 [Kwoniella sp. DSM 27419]